ncbi:MAG: hypothetical protein ACBZ72_13320 [Candidatus Bathyarchaeia archaeon]|jgi:hypothetical protein
MNALKALENRLRGWLPKEPCLPSPQRKAAEPTRKEMPSWERRAFKITMVADGAMLGTFLAAHWTADAYTRSSEVSAVFWAIFIPSLFFVNLVVYWHFKKQAQKGE